jgi:transposase
MAWQGLTDRQWNAVVPLLPPVRFSAKGGRPRTDDRRCFNGMLWVLRTGAPWKEIPERFAPGSTCHRRFEEWVAADLFLSLWAAFLKTLNKAERIDWRECFEDGSFAPAKKGVKRSEKPRKVRVQSG